MAHQAHNLPWTLLADNFKFVHSNARYDDRTNLYPCFKPGQGKQLQHFARVFARTINDFSVQERKKFPKLEDMTPLEPDEPFISEASAARIARVTKLNVNSPTYSARCPSLTNAERCICYWVMELNEPSWPYPDASLLELLEWLKALLLYGDMEPLFRLAALPDVQLQRVWGYPDDEGWDELLDTFLTAYILLNVLSLKPELWDPPSRAAKLASLRRPGTVMSESKSMPENWDYRLTSSYQWTLITSVTARTHKHTENVGTLPHREFFGVEKGTYSSYKRWGDCRDALGKTTLSNLMDEDYKKSNHYVHAAHDIPVVINMLGQKGLPTELALEILELAEYSKPKRRTTVADDPLHPQNRDELKKYLSYCWRVLVRVDMLAQANRCRIDWECQVAEKIFRLWGVPYPKMAILIPETPEWEVDDAREHVMGQTLLRTFV
jgi:hypothetical protein